MFAKLILNFQESISCQVGQVKWDVKSANKVHATFQLPGFRDGSKFTHFYFNLFILDMKLMIGDDLRLKHFQTLDGKF